MQKKEEYNVSGKHHRSGGVSSILSTPEHNVLMVSFCDCLLSVVRRQHLPFRGHIYCLNFMKLGQKIYTNDILDEFENGSGWLKNMSSRGGVFFLIWL